MEKKSKLSRTFHVSPLGVLWGVCMIVAVMLFIVGCILEWVCMGIIFVNNAIDELCTYVSAQLDKHCE